MLTVKDNRFYREPDSPDAAAEIAALRAERDNLKHTADVAMETNALLHREAAALRARVAELEDHMEQMLRCPSAEGLCEDCETIARNLLTRLSGNKPTSLPEAK